MGYLVAMAGSALMAGTRNKTFVHGVVGARSFAMIARMPSRATSSSARERLVAAAADLIATGGVRSVTARTLAEATGQSPSAVNYHFDGREGLLAATFEEAAGDISAWRSGWLATLAADPPSDAFAGWFLALTLERVGSRTAFLVLRELRHQSARSPAHRPLARQEAEAADRFWAAALAQFGLPAEAAGACADYTEAILGIHGGPPDHPDHTAWLVETTRRFCARLSGDRGQAPGWDGWRQFARARGAPEASPGLATAPASAVRIAGAAAAVLGRDGMEGLTHRAVAAEIGLSLAAVSGHFPSRVSLVRAAFDHLIASIQLVRGGVAPDPAVRRPLIEVAAETAEALFDEDGAASPGLLALDELLTAAIREPDLRRDAEDLRASRGENSAKLLHGINHAAYPVDGLDAHILSIATTGAMRSAYAQEPAVRRPWLAARLTASVGALFG